MLKLQETPNPWGKEREKKTKQTGWGWRSAFHVVPHPINPPPCSFSFHLSRTKSCPLVLSVSFFSLQDCTLLSGVHPLSFEVVDKRGIVWMPAWWGERYRHVENNRPKKPKRERNTMSVYHNSLGAVAQLQPETHLAEEPARACQPNKQR